MSKYIPFSEWLINNNHECGSWADTYQAILKRMGVTPEMVCEQFKDSDGWSVAAYINDHGDTEEIVFYGYEEFPLVSDQTLDVMMWLYYDIWYDLPCGLGPVLAADGAAIAEEWKSAAYVYLIKAGDWYKIGFAKDVERRMKNLQPGNRERLKLLAYSITSTPREDERKLHQKFKQRPRRGEWFRLTKDDIKSLVDPWPLHANFPGYLNL